MSSAHQAKHQSEVIYSARVQKGIFLAIASIISPVILILTQMIYVGIWPEGEHQLFIFAATLVVVSAFWASAVITCIWDMIRYGSHMSATGLFILLMAPIIWTVAAMLLGKIWLMDILSNYSVENLL